MDKNRYLFYYVHLLLINFQRFLSINSTKSWYHILEFQASLRLLGKLVLNPPFPTLSFHQGSLLCWTQCVCRYALHTWLVQELTIFQGKWILFVVDSLTVWQLMALGTPSWGGVGKRADCKMRDRFWEEEFQPLRRTLDTVGEEVCERNSAGVACRKRPYRRGSPNLAFSIARCGEWVIKPLLCT